MYGYTKSRHLQRLLIDVREIRLELTRLLIGTSS